MQVDVEEVGLTVAPVHDVLLPYLLAQGAGSAEDVGHRALLRVAHLKI
jgi:hypothetical protein